LHTSQPGQHRQGRGWGRGTDTKGRTKNEELRISKAATENNMQQEATGKGVGKDK